ncbi:YDG domain-containing protein [Lachnospiraceae bacterium C1.1]|nr:YDG domain-containing protein [Lachnospiraceae bacterium C1.1]
MKRIKDMLRRIGTAGLAAIMLTAQMPVTAFASESQISVEEVVENITAENVDDVITEQDDGRITEAADVSGEDESDKESTGEDTSGETGKGKETVASDDSSSADVQDEEKAEAIEEKDAKAEDISDKEDSKMPAFEESKSINGVRITVTADEGVFPEGATLSVEKVTVAQEKQAEEAVESERDEDKQVAASYTYDIKVLDQDRNEIQPANANGEDSSSRVKVSFKLDEVADENLDTNVYHITENENETAEKSDDSGNGELTAEKLEVETDGDTAIAETDGFSLYTVEFTYDNKQYVLPGDSEMALSEVLDTVGLTGEVSAVEVSNESLFSAKKCKTADDGSTPEKDEDGNPIEAENGTWFVFAHQAFSTEEWMKVTIGGVVYEITVTDDEVSTLQVDNDIAEGTAGRYYVNMPTTGTNTLTITADDITAGKGAFKVYDDGGKNGNYSYKCNGYLTISVPENCTLQLSGEVKLTETNSTVESGANPIFKVFDGTSSETQITSVWGNGSSYGPGSDRNIGTLNSSGNTVTLYLYNDKTKTNGVGANITVTVISPDTEYDVSIADGITHGSVTSDKAKAKADETITLTATPASGYLLNGISVTDIYSNAVHIDFTPWYKGKTGATTATFTMPKSAVTVTPTFTKIDNTSNEFSINLPKSGTETGTIFSGIKSFKVYDDGGVSGNYSKGCDGSITLTAPEGFGFQIEGKTITYHGYGSLTVSNSKGTILNGVHGSRSEIYAVYTVNPVASADQTLTITFETDSNWDPDAGVDLTVSVIDLTQEFSITVDATDHGTVTPSKTKAKAGDVITLTPSPNSGYMIKSVAVTDSESKNVSVSGAWWTENFSFTMPYGNVTVTPVAEAANVDGGLVIDGLTYVGKSGDNPGYYKIDSPNALGTLASYVNGGGRSVDMLFKQTADINMSGQGYTPIGSSTNNPFNGTYDGNGYVILNLSYTSDTGEGLSGMFGKIVNGTVKNVNLKDCSFNGNYAGGVAGDMNGGTIDHCSVIGGTVSCGTGNYSGGIVGYFIEGTVKDCFAANTVSAYSASNGKNGPIVGWSDGYTANNYYTVAVSGGNSTGTQISGGFVMVGEGVTIGSGVFRTIGRTAEHTYYFGKQDDAITFSAEVPTAGMKKFATTAGTLSGTTTAGTVSLTMPASDVTVSLDNVTLNIADIEEQTYTGSAIKPAVTVYDGSTLLTADTDYTVSYSDNTNAGTATATITGKGAYLGTVSKTFVIKKASINPVVSIEGWTYGDPANAPSVSGNPGNGAVTYQYRLLVNGSVDSDVVPTAASELYYRVRATIAETENYKGGTADATFKIEKKPVTVTGLSVSDKTYDGTTNATVTGMDTAVINGLVGNDNVTITSVVAAFADKNVGKNKTVTFTEISFVDGESIANRNYTLSAQPASVTASITPREVTVDGITVSNKTFDGTTAATVDCSSATFTGVIDGDTVTINGVNGSFADANVGDGKTVTLNYTDATLGGADGGNYKLVATGNQADATANITKAAAAAVPEINRTYLYTAGGAGSINIGALLPSNCGTASYTTSQSGDVTFSSEPAVTDGVLAYTIAPGDLNKTGTITIKAETQNYEDITITVNVKLADRKPVELKSGTSVTLNKDTLTYGEALSTLTFQENTAVFVEQGNTGNVIPGTIDWKTPSEKPAAGTTSAVWVFTPTDTTYASLEGTVSIAVDKATLEITTVPTASAITYGQTLADSNLENGAAKLGETDVEGTFSWNDITIAPAVSDSNKTEYTVKFTPNDSVNFTEATCKVKLTVNKAEISDSDITAPAAISDLSYTGSAQELVTAGSVAGGIGTVKYYSARVDEPTNQPTAPADDSAYTTTIPTGTNAGTYYVWYKVVGDANHNDVAAQSITVIIGKAQSGTAWTRTVEVQKGNNIEASVSILGFVGTNASLVGDPTVDSTTGSVAASDFAISSDKKSMTFKVTSVEGGEGNVTATLSSDNYESFTLKIPVQVKAKTTEVKLEYGQGFESSVQSIEVSGLDALTNTLNGTNVKVELDVKLESEPSDGTVNEKIKNDVDQIFSGVERGSVKKEYLDISVKQTVDSTESTVADVGRVIEIAVKFDLTGKYNPVVVREHGGSVARFTALALKPGSGYTDGTYYVDNTHGTIYIYTRYFSTYTIAYATVNSYMISFDAQGGSSVQDIVVTAGGNISTLPTSTRSGYSFDGWFTSSSGGNQLTTSTTINENVTYYAHWTQSGSGGSGDTPTPEPTPDPTPDPTPTPTPDPEPVIEKETKTVKATATYKKEKITVSVDMSWDNEITYTGNKITPSDLGYKLDLSDLYDEVKIKKGNYEPKDLFKVTYVHKNNLHKSTAKKKASLYAKITLNEKTAKKAGLTKNEIARLKAIIMALNKQLKKTPCVYTIDAVDMDAEGVEIVADVTWTKKSKIKKAKSIRVTAYVNGEKKTFKLKSGQYKISVKDASAKTVKITGKKDFTGTVIVNTK